MEKIYNQINAAVMKNADEIIKISHTIHDDPELGNEEFHACETLCTYLEKEGFDVKRGVGGLKTAFTAAIKGKGDGPNIAVLAEYDALKDIGHACGHNMIAAIAAGTAASLKDTLAQYPGSITVVGTPAEETTGGKINLIEAGVFEGFDFALEVHPTSGHHAIMRGGRACTTVYCDFTGVSAHSSKPASGVNAVTAVVETFHNIDVLRPLFDPMDNVNGVIPYGGGANNVISGFASCEFCLRSDTLHNLKNLVEKVKLAANCSASLLGAKVDIRVDPMFAERYPNRPMGLRFKAHLEEMGESVVEENPFGPYGSSDIGNVSLLMPSVHEYISIADEDVNGHSAEMCAAAASARGDKALIMACKALAMTIADLLADGNLRKEAKAFYDNQIPAVYKK